MSPAPHGPGRVAELDALRGIAALAVLLFHFTTQFDQTYGHAGRLPFACGIGKYGVHLFFVISGFVIFMTLERTQSALDFAVSRFSRLFPAYWTALALTLLAVQLAGLPGQAISARDVLVNLTMVIDLLQAREADGSYWTLQIELLFYGQMLFWFCVGGMTWIRALVGGWTALATLYAFAAWEGHPLSYLVRELLIVRFIPFFAAGILLYRIWRDRDPLWQNLLLLAGCVLASWEIWSWREALTLALACALIGLLAAQRLRFLAWRPLLFLGSISYTLYLLHQTIGFIVIARLEKAGVTPAASIAAATAIVVALATVVSALVERPALLAIRRSYRKWRESGPIGAARGAP